VTWLTDEQIDQIIANASADDIIEAMALYPNVEQAPMQLTREIFNRSADRLGLTNGVTAAQMIPANRYADWIEKVSDLMKRDNPLSEDTVPSQTSAASGE
jgi:hypothetical protein